jgi:hypothetical protein
LRSWEKVGEAIGNLEALQDIQLHLNDRPPLVPDWNTLSCVLSFLGHEIKLHVGYYRSWNEVNVHLFAMSISDIPFINVIVQSCHNIPAWCFAIFMNALVTLPSLEDVVLLGRDERNQLSASTMISMQVLLQSRSLRSLWFESYCITREMVQCLILALNGNDSTLTCLRLDVCIFPDVGVCPNAICVFIHLMGICESL